MTCTLLGNRTYGSVTDMLLYISMGRRFAYQQGIIDVHEQYRVKKKLPIAFTVCPLFLEGVGGCNRFRSRPTIVFPFHFVVTRLMKGTKALTLGAGREVLPHNMAVTKM